MSTRKKAKVPKFNKWLFGPEKFSGLSRNGHQVSMFKPARFAVRLRELQIFPIVRKALSAGLFHQHEINN